MFKKLFLITLLFVCLCLLSSCIHYLPKEERESTAPSETESVITTAPPRESTTPKPDTDPTPGEGFPNDPDPDGTKRY